MVDGSDDGREILPVEPMNPEAMIIDWTTDPDMYAGFRLDLGGGDGGDEQRFLVVLAPEGAASSATPAGEGDELGVDISFASGATPQLVQVRAASRERSLESVTRLCSRRSFSHVGDHVVVETWMQQSIRAASTCRPSRQRHTACR